MLSWGVIQACSSHSLSSCSLQSIVAFSFLPLPFAFSAHELIGSLSLLSPITKFQVISHSRCVLLLRTALHIFRTLSPLSFAPLRNASCKLPDADPSCLDPNSPFRSSGLNCSSLASDCQSISRSSPVPITARVFYSLPDTVNFPFLFCIRDPPATFL
ncbi:hypothetical protein BDV06DRAFT_1408 [Aspergillus oleicola]